MEQSQVKSSPTTEDFFVQGRGMGSIAVFYRRCYMVEFICFGFQCLFLQQRPCLLTAIAWNIFSESCICVGKRIWFYGKKIIILLPATSLRINMIQVFSKSGRIMLLFTLPYLQIQPQAVLISSGSFRRAYPRKIGGIIFYVVIIIYVWAGGLRAVA